MKDLDALRAAVMEAVDSKASRDPVIFLTGITNAQNQLIRALEKRVEELKKAVSCYGGHLESCERNMRREGSDACTCGFRQAWNNAMPHDENCDSLLPGPDLGPSTKPCNCRRP